MIKSTDSDESFFNTLNSILADLKNGHAGMLDKNLYTYLKSFYDKNTELNEAWAKQLDTPKTTARYSRISDAESKPKISSENIIDNNVKTCILKKNKAAYLSIHSFNTFNIDADMKIIKPFLESIRDYESLIIDIRGNGGGNSLYWSSNIIPLLLDKPLFNAQYIVYRGGSFQEQFIQSITRLDHNVPMPIINISKENLMNIPPELTKDFKYYCKYTQSYEPKNYIGFKGKIYMLIDGSVFSSSEAFAIFAKDTGFATLVGEKTGGDGIGIDPAVCSLPNSGYVFRFPMDMGLSADGTCNFEHKTEPNIKVSPKVGSTFSNDEAVQTVLKLVN